MPNESLEEIELTNRIRWLINLRWFAVAGVIGILIFLDQIFHINLPYPILYILGCALFLYNIIFFFYSLHPVSKKYKNWFANIQITFDLITLSLLLHFSGGIENPFIFYFIFHMIIASILLTVRSAYIQATLAILLVAGISFLESTGIIRHYSVIKNDLYKDPTHLLGEGIAFMTTLYIAVYMATSIAGRLRQRTREIQDLNLILKEHDRIKSEYVIRVSHDIQAHLGAIHSCLEVVTSGFVGDLSEKAGDFIKRAKHRTEVLLHFVKDLLELARIKIKKGFEMKPLDIESVIKSVMDTIRIRPEEREINIRLEIPENLSRIKGDEVSIKEVFNNLLINAIKYTPKGGKIVVSARELDDSVLVEIRDTGIGVPSEDREKIFEDFYRSKNAKEIDKDGTGLGLSIVKQIIEAHNGRIWVESELGKGSSFKFVLPKA